MRPHSLLIYLNAMLLVAATPANGQNTPTADKTVAPITLQPTTPGGLETYIPEKLNYVPNGNNYQDPASEFCFQRSKASAHFLMLWAKEYGENPMENPNPGRRFQIDEVLNAAELSYDIFVNRLKWAPDPKAMAHRYKMLIIVTGGKSNTAYGGSAENKVGVLWTPATRIHQGPYGIVPHELGHSFQALTRADGAPRFENNSTVAEMTSQFQLWQVFPEWQTFENYHLKDYLKATHLAFLHPDNRYHSCYPLEYWSFRHGPEIIGHLWRSAQKGEDLVMTYQRVTKLDQKRFNEEMFDAARRFVTWDLPRIEKVSARYANQHHSTLLPISEGWFKIDPKQTPQNYGYNAIRLMVPPAKTNVQLEFKGTAGQEGASQIKLEEAGWRYGFLAQDEGGKRHYGTMGTDRDGKISYEVPVGTKFLWLVVMGAPEHHWIHDEKRIGVEGWPYQIRIEGSSPDPSMVGKS